MKMSKNESMKGAPILGLVFGGPVGGGPGRVAVSSTALSEDVTPGKLYRVCPDVDTYLRFIKLTNASLLGSVAGPWDMAPGDTLVVDVNGAGDQTATFDAAAAARECANSETFALEDGMTLTVKVDRGAVQTITIDEDDFVDVAAATAEEVALVIDTAISGASAAATSAGAKVTISSDRKGTSSYVQVTGGTANAVLGFATTEAQGTGDVADIDAVTFSEAKAVIEADITDVLVTEVESKLRIESTTPGAVGSLKVSSACALDTVLGLSTTIVNGTGSAVTATTGARVPADSIEVFRVPDDVTHIQLLGQGSGYCWVNEMGV